MVVNNKPEMLIINLNKHYVDCYVCSKPTIPKYGIPMYEDIVLPNDWDGEWFGQTVCRRCFSIQEQLKKPVCMDKLLDSRQETEQ